MNSYEEKTYTLFYYWLIVSFFLVLSMIIVGGLTRLTDSGLSITEWELFAGILPPLSNESWDKYFSLYKEIPQFKLLNNNMTLNEFKIIFYWEYAHRFLGRFLGLFFLIPLIYFYFSRVIKKSYISTSTKILLLIISQGIVGWYMVKSGLVDKVTVSHYRLSIHLTIAFVIISMIFWMILNVRKKAEKRFLFLNKSNLIFYFFILLIFAQIILGAFVSGLDAGRIYQTWPLMGETYFPNDIIIQKFTNFFDFNNHSLTQFYHRTTAYLLFFYTIFVGYYIFKNKIYLMKHFYLVSVFLFLQIILGVVTLISGLNIYLASGHQIGSLLLILSVYNLFFQYIK